MFPQIVGEDAKLLHPYVVGIPIGAVFLALCSRGNICNLQTEGAAINSAQPTAYRVNRVLLCFFISGCQS